MRTLISLMVLIVLAAFPAAANAHQGKTSLISCGEIDGSFKKFPQGKSDVTLWVSNDDGPYAAVATVAIDGPADEVSVGWRNVDAAQHTVRAYFAWTADGGGQTAVAKAQVTLCGPFPAPPGTPGDGTGTPGPAGPPGPPGPPGDPTNDPNVVKWCTSKRTYRFVVTGQWRGPNHEYTAAQGRVAGVTASEPGFQVRVTRLMINGKRRFRVSVKPVTLNAQRAVKGMVRTTTVVLRLANGTYWRAVEKWRQCISADGTLNDISASAPVKVGRPRART